VNRNTYGLILGICVEGLKKTTKIVGPGDFSLGQDLPRRTYISCTDLCYCSIQELHIMVTIIL